jgi:hypothetical protein
MHAAKVAKQEVAASQEKGEVELQPAAMPVALQLRLEPPPPPVAPPPPPVVPPPPPVAVPH